MYRIALLDMPFSEIARPSIALTQLRSVLRHRFTDQLSIQIIYIKHDFARFMGIESYNYLSSSMESFNTGAGDWLFRQEAFPESSDDTDAYLRRCFPRRTQALRFKAMIGQKRPEFGNYMDKLISLYKLDKAEIVGFTSMFMQNTASFAMAKRLKQRNPSVITIMGGANCEFPMGEVIARRVKDIDFVFSGPALKSLPEFVQYCLNEESFKCHAIRGVLSQRALLKCGADTIGDDLSIDAPPELDYDSFVRRLQNYFPADGIEPILPFETSRGCWWGQRAHCTFCGLNGASMGYRAMKPETAVLQFKSLFRYSGRVSQLAAVDNILPKNYLLEVLPLLETPKNMEIFYEVKADLNEKDISVLADARVKSIQPGIESLSTSTLKLMKKGTTVFQNLKLLQLCAQYGIRPFWNLLIGFPGEGEETYKWYMKILPLLFHLPPPSDVYPVRFDRFSPYHSHPESYGLDLQPMDFYSLVYPFDDEDLKRIAYYFFDRNTNAEYAVAVAKWLDPLRDQVKSWHSRWEGSDHSLPRVEFDEMSNCVQDSRSARPIEHALRENSWVVLSRLSNPTRVEVLVSQMFAEFGYDVTSELRSLEQAGLIFREGDRIVSLVPSSSVGTGDLRQNVVA